LRRQQYLALFGNLRTFSRLGGIVNAPRADLVIFLSRNRVSPQSAHVGAFAVSHFTLSKLLYTRGVLFPLETTDNNLAFAMAGMGSPMPYIKDEPEDSFNFNGNGFAGMNGMPMFGNTGQQYGNFQNTMPADMSDMNMNANLQRGNYTTQQNMSSNYNPGNSGIDDDELADLINYPDSNQPSMHQSGFNMHQDPIMAGNFGSVQGHSAIAMTTQSQLMNTMYSQTPDGPGPIQSPFAHSFNYAQYVMQPHAQSPMQRPSHGRHGGSFDMTTRIATLRQDRPGSASKSPLTPKTPNTAAGLGRTPDSIPQPGQPISGSLQRGHQKVPSGQWDAFGSPHSYLDSPMSSPQSGALHPTMEEVMASSNKRSDSMVASAPASNIEAKRQKRRQSHNAVERRRRDNINDRIQELARLVPAHRLDDDKVKKHLTGNNSASVGSMSPPQASSLLATSSGRRAMGSISQGIPADEKDKGPAKGDVLNGAVGWTRDLMWMLHRKLQQETVLLETIASLGGTNPLQGREDEQRMESELLDAIQRNGVINFSYSRAPGSTLYVPNVSLTTECA